MISAAPRNDTYEKVFLSPFCQRADRAQSGHTVCPAGLRSALQSPGPQIRMWIWRASSRPLTPLSSMCQVVFRDWPALCRGHYLHYLVYH